MDTEDLLPRLALFGGLVAALIVYRRSRAGQLKAVRAEVADEPAGAAPAATKAGTGIAVGSQGWIEGLLDNVAEQALKELKKVLKDGLQRLDKIVEEL